MLFSFVFVPVIWWSFCVVLSYVPLPANPAGATMSQLLGATSKSHGSWATIQLIMYVGYFVVLDPACGVAYAPFLGVMYWHATRSVKREREQAPGAQRKGGPWKMWQIAVALQILSWWAQIHPG